VSPEGQRIAIAEVCGWTNVTQGVGPNRNLFLGDKPMRDSSGKVYGYTVDQRVPDYFNDLNAMYAAEEVLVARGLHSAYYDELISVTTVDRFFLIHATAAQRAEAFLRTLGKWETNPVSASAQQGTEGL
jgi:hypothetical protein